MTAFATSAKSPPAASPGLKQQAAKTESKRTATSLWACLLVSADERLRRRMSLAATSAGWNPVECQTPEESLRQAVLINFPLALVDLGGAYQATSGGRSDSTASGARASEGAIATPHPAGFASYGDLLRMLKQSASNLVVICDRDSNPEGELWSRQLGAWMYLPNVDEKSDLARICREAKAIAEKLRGTSLTHAAP